MIDTILLSLAVPFVGAFVVAFLGRWPNVREGATLATAGGLFVVVARLLTLSEVPTCKLLEVLPGLWVEFDVEPLGLIYAVTASALWIITSVYSIGYMRHLNEGNQTRYYACFAVALGSSMGIAFAANMFTLFIFYEVLTLCTYPLVTHRGDADSVRGGRRYLGILLTTSVCFLLFGILGTWVATGGNIDFERGGVFRDVLAAKQSSALYVGILFVLYIYGIGKAALMPFHRWLPSAMVAPAPVSALLHAVAVVKAGVFTVLKITFYIFGIDTLAELGNTEWLVYVSGTSIVLASIVALFQDNIKARLAYSTISQLSYIVMAAALFTSSSIMAGSLHIAAHALGKITLFFAAGAIYAASHKILFSDCDGIGRRMPFTMAAFTVGSLSMIGLPPTAGFVSKWYLLKSAWEVEHVFAVAVIFLSAVLNAAYFLPVVYQAFFKEPRDPEPGHEAHGEAPLPCVIALMLTAMGTLAFFFFPNTFLELAQKLVGDA